MNAEFGPKGIHLCHILIDGPVESPDTFGKVFLGPDGCQKLLEERGQGKDDLIIPVELAETYFHKARQHRSSWTHELDLRPFTKRPCGTAKPERSTLTDVLESNGKLPENRS